MEQPGFTWSSSSPFTAEQWENCHLVRFDYLLRKVINCCAKESTENFNEDTIQQTWFFMLDSIFHIKYKQLDILNKLKEGAIAKARQAGILLSDDGLNADIEDVNKRYAGHTANVDEFFKSRIAFAVEQTLKHIELEEFLDHIVTNDQEIMFKELRDMILLIFGETANEHAVLLNATRTANQQDIASFELIGQDVSHGLHFDYRRCLICKRFVDEIREMQNKRLSRGKTIGTSYALDSDSEDDYEQPYIDPFIDGLTLFECGHPFHIKCVEKHIRDSMMEKEGSRGNPRKGKGAFEVTQRMIEQTPCPHCYSEKFKIDFESIFNRKNQIGRGVASTRKFSEDETTKSVASERSANSDDS